MFILVMYDLLTYSDASTESKSTKISNTTPPNPYPITGPKVEAALAIPIKFLKNS